MAQLRLQELSARGHRLHRLGPRGALFVDHELHGAQVALQERVADLLQQERVAGGLAFVGRGIRRADALPFQSPECGDVGEIDWGEGISQ